MATYTNAYAGGGGGGRGAFCNSSLLLTCIRKSENDTKPKSNSLKFQCFI